MSLLEMTTLIVLVAMPISITLLQKHGQTFPPPQALPSPPLLLLITSAPPLPSTTPMPSSVPLEYPQPEETPTSTALMAQTPSPPPAPPLAPLLHHGVPFLNQQTNQSPPLLVTFLTLAFPSPSMIPMPSSVPPLEYPQPEEKPSSTALMAQTPLPQTVLPLVPLLPHGVLSLNQQTNQSPPLLVTLSSAPPSPSTIPMPSSVPLEYQEEEKPSSTALMAQTPLPQTAPPLAPPPPLLLPHGVLSLNQQTNQSPPLLLTLPSAFPSPSTIPMPSSVPLENHQTEETPISTVLMAQMPLPQTAPLLVPSLHHGVPSLNQQTNQSPPLLINLSSASPSPSTTPMPLLEQREHPPSEEKPISTALMAVMPSTQVAKL